MKIDDRLKNVCCAGFDWTIVDIVDLPPGGDRNVWGVCQNPKCQHAGEATYYHLSILIEDGFAAP